MLAGLVLICATAALPAFAYSSHVAHTVLVESSDRDSHTKSTTATCPEGQHALFGGFGAGTFLRALRRSADNGWKVVTVAPPITGTPTPPT